MTMISRIARGCTKCLNTTNTNTTALHTNTTTFQPLTLHPRSIDSKASQGLHASAIAGIIFAVLGWAVKSNRLAFEASGGRRGQTRRNGRNGRAPRGESPLQRGTMRSGAREQGGLVRGTSPMAPGGFTAATPRATTPRAPPRVYGGGARGTAPRFPGPRNGYATTAPQGRGPYADGGAYTASAAWEGRGRNEAGNAGYIV